MDGRELAKLFARTCEEYKAEDIRVLDVRPITDVTDYLVIATLDTRVQMRGVVDSIRKATKTLGEKKPYVEGMDLYRWVLLDYFDCVVHLLDPEARDFYELESLWGDAANVDWEQQETA
jgi:ribosome-associated protein